MADGNPFRRRAASNVSPALRVAPAAYELSFDSDSVEQPSTSSETSQGRVFTPALGPPALNLTRLHSESEELLANPPAGCVAGPKGDDLFEWAAVIEGPTGTPYEGGIFFLEMSVPSEYPFKPPKVTFLTRIYHCNFNSSGGVSLDLLGDGWTSSMSIETVLKAIRKLLIRCETEIAIFNGCASLYQTDKAEHDRIARIWTQRYAC